MLEGWGPSSMVSQTSRRPVANDLAAGPKAWADGRTNCRNIHGSGPKNRIIPAVAWWRAASAAPQAFSERTTMIQVFTRAAAIRGRSARSVSRRAGISGCGRSPGARQTPAKAGKGVLLREAHGKSAQPRECRRAAPAATFSDHKGIAFGRFHGPSVKIRIRPDKAGNCLSAKARCA